MNYDVMMIGPIAHDHNIDYQGDEVFELGGAVYFSAAAAKAANAKVYAAIKMAKQDESILENFQLPRSSISILPSSATTLMRNQYFTADREKRRATALAQSDRIHFEEIPKVNTTLYHLAGLLYHDFSSDIILKLSEKGLVSADIQGFLRHRNPLNGEMYFEDWEDKKKYFKYFNFLKTDAAEAEILTGTSDRKEAAIIMHSWGAKEIMISYNKEILVYDGSDFYTCPIKARNLSGRTGRGDTTFGAYIAKRINGNSIKDALLFATAMVSLKMETPGAFKGTSKDVENYIKDFYSGF